MSDTTTTDTSDTAGSPARPKLERRSHNRVIAGVCDAIGRHLGVDPLVIRLAFVATTAVSGIGIPRLCRRLVQDSRHRRLVTTAVRLRRLARGCRCPRLTGDSGSFASRAGSRSRRGGSNVVAATDSGEIERRRSPSQHRSLNPDALVVAHGAAIRCTDGRSSDAVHRPRTGRRDLRRCA
jgi:phage shock protein PspC (stress-responsive transcriptional regulator)